MTKQTTHYTSVPQPAAGCPTGPPPPAPVSVSLKPPPPATSTSKAHTVDTVKDNQTKEKIPIKTKESYAFKASKQTKEMEEVKQQTEKKKVVNNAVES